MPSINRAQILGHLGQDPEVRYTQNQTPVANLSIATNWKGKDGQESTEWHRVTVWGKQAEWIGGQAQKGDLVFVEGRIQTRKWEDRDGNTRYQTEIVATTAVPLGRVKKGQDAAAPDHNDDVPF